MSKIITQKEISKTVSIRNGKEVVRSDNLAKMFGKTHKQVLALLRKKQDFLLGNSISQKEYFIEEKHTKQGGEYSRYYLTRKGFDLIALSLTGKNALKYKLWYIDRFHEQHNLIVEHKLTAKLNKSDDMWVEFRNEGKVFRDKLTKAINDKIVVYRNNVEKKMNDGKYYYHYTSLIYSVLGIDLPKGTNPRDVLDKRMLVRLEDMEDKVADMIMKCDLHYKDCYKEIRERLV